jgi:hypothetical protein
MKRQLALVKLQFQRAVLRTQAINPEAAAKAEADLRSVVSWAPLPPPPPCPLCVCGAQLALPAGLLQQPA